MVENITKTYKKAENTVYNKLNKEAGNLAEKLGIGDRIECLAKKQSFITLKDHESNFVNKPQGRQINPAKSELGKVRKKIVDNITTK